MKSIIIARKEFRELLKNRSTLLTALAVALFFSFVYSMAITEEAAEVIIPVDGTIFFLSVVLGVFMAFSLTGHAFYKEKTDRIIETLLSGPITIRQIWLGKILGVSLLSYILTLLAMVFMIVIANVRSENLVFPGMPVVVHIFIVVPVFIGAFVGLNGLAQLALGMRENRFVGFILFVPLFAGLYGIGMSIGAVTEITWLYIGLTFAAAFLLICLAAFLIRFLSKERIITTLS